MMRAMMSGKPTVRAKGPLAASVDFTPEDIVTQFFGD